MAHELGIIGAGNMAEAIVRGAIRAGRFAPADVVAADVVPARRELFRSQLRVRAVAENVEAATDARIILLSVKPQQMADVLGGLGRVMSPRTLVISIAAGISNSFIENALAAGKEWRVVRAMPNTPLLVGEGMVALARGRHASDEDVVAARSLFGESAPAKNGKEDDAASQSGGQIIELPETLMDAVTAVSGSGPAYFFYLAEQMIQAGIDLGLMPEDARRLAAQTALGAGRMLANLPDSPQELRRRVTSPNGTTHAAITLMESREVGSALREAVKAAARRSKELGQ